ncbi:hypothetical protein AAWM_10500 [Aspergillus awamori]|uniref:Uncharacterized protein n=1 Tax=Aspergillus awamori TaxID=105351 RepID=A0A401L823_ASPAW|nr:hypothetical protein AAWM_10500 [Aspergillus awamori]
MRPKVAEAPSSTTLDVSPSSVLLSQFIPTPLMSSSLPMSPKDFTNSVFSFTSGTYVPVNEQAATPLVVPGSRPYTGPTQGAKSETGGTRLPHPSLIATGAFKVHQNADGTSAIMIGPVQTYDTIQTGSTAFERSSQPTQLSQPHSLCISPSSLNFEDAVQGISTYSVPQLALDPQDTIQLHYPQGSASFSWKYIEFIPTEHLSIELGAHSLSPAELSQPFSLQGPSDGKQPSSTEHANVASGTVVSHGSLPMTLTPKPLIEGQSGAKPFVNLSSIGSGLGSFQITSLAASAYLFLQDRIIPSKSTGIVVSTSAAEYSTSMKAGADRAMQTDSLAQQGPAFAKTSQMQGLQKLTNTLIQQPHSTPATQTHRSYSESTYSSASDKPDRGMSGRSIGVMAGAVVGGTCGFLGIFATAVWRHKRKRRRVWISNQYWNDPNPSSDDQQPSSKGKTLGKEQDVKELQAKGTAIGLCAVVSRQPCKSWDAADAVEYSSSWLTSYVIELQNQTVTLTNWLNGLKVS